MLLIFIYFYFYFYSIFDGKLIVIAEFEPEKILVDDWLIVSSVFSPRHSDVSLIQAVDYLTGHFSNGKFYESSVSLLLRILDRSI